MKRTTTSKRRLPDGSAGTPTAHPRPLRRRGAARSIVEHAPETESQEGLVSHPDGWYWVAPDGRQQFGPFESCSLARADRDRASEEAVNEAQAEREAEFELGVADAVREDASRPDDGDEAMLDGGRPGP